MQFIWLKYDHCEPSLPKLMASKPVVVFRYGSEISESPKDVDCAGDGNTATGIVNESILTVVFGIIDTDYIALRNPVS